MSKINKINSVVKKVKFIRTDLWNELNAKVKSEVEIAIKQLDNGEGIPHEQAIKKLKRWEA